MTSISARILDPGGAVSGSRHRLPDQIQIDSH